MTQQEFIGFDKIKQLTNILKSFNASKVFLVTGKSSYQLSGVDEEISKLSSIFEFTRFYEFQKNPCIEDVETGIALFQQMNIDITVAIGGGSVIDMAKLINILAPQSGEPTAYIRQESLLKVHPVPLIAIPTTAGSGSEATHFAVVYIDKYKYSLAHQSILPKATIIDPNLSMTLPKSVTATSGMDALCQAIESYWSIHSTKQSRAYASKAIKIIISHLAITYYEPTPKRRLYLAQAAHYAGKAINITKTTAAHAFSYPFTSFFDIPHGHAVSLTIGSLLEYNSKVTDMDLSDGRGVAYVKQSIDEIISLLGASDVSSAKEVISALMRKIGLQTTFKSLDIDLEKEWYKISQNINLERLRNNPRLFNSSSLKSLILGIDESIISGKK